MIKKNHTLRSIYSDEVRIEFEVGDDEDGVGKLFQ